jgi:hypothetical protein
VGRLDDAAREFREVLRLNADNTDAKRMLEKVARRAPERR